MMTANCGFLIGSADHFYSFEQHKSYTQHGCCEGGGRGERTIFIAGTSGLADKFFRTFPRVSHFLLYVALPLLLRIDRPLFSLCLCFRFVGLPYRKHPKRGQIKFAILLARLTRRGLLFLPGSLFSQFWRISVEEDQQKMNER